MHCTVEEAEIEQECAGMRAIAAAVLAMNLVACGRASDVITFSPVPLPEPLPAPPPPEPVIESVSLVPAGTRLRVALSETVGTLSRVGDRFSAIVTSPLFTTGGAVVVPAGSVASGTITAIDPAGYAGSRALVRLDIDRITVNGRTHPLSATIVEVDPELPPEEEARLASLSRNGAEKGVILGSIYTDAELRTVLKDRSIAAGRGTVISLGDGTIEPALPAGTVLTLRTTRDLLLAG